VYDFCLQLWSRGGELVDKEGIVTLDTLEAIDALDFYRRVVKDRSLTPPSLELIDSVASGAWFASGEIAMMVNWFGFAAVCELSGSPTKGRVAVAPLPAGEYGSSASLNVYWLLAIASGSTQKEEAYAFIRHCASPEMDRITTLEGGIGCRLSTWNDPEVNVAIPFYSQLAKLHHHTREFPRSVRLPELIRIIDHAVARALSTDRPSRDILREAHVSAEQIRM
jgi:multiple sugar transport system substrate-binding protein